MRVTSDAARQLETLPQFHGISTDTLIRIVRCKTKLCVSDRWVAISLILSNHCPIPVMKGQSDADAR
jgi:hypothetical protein